jgi:adenylate cyclase
LQGGSRDATLRRVVESGGIPSSERALDAVSGVLRTISRSSFDLDQVLEAVIKHAVELARADFGNIVRQDEASATWRPVAHHGMVDPRYWQLVTNTAYQAERGTLIGRVLMEMRPVQIVDIFDDPEYEFWETQKLTGFRTILGIPMLRDRRLIGLFVVWRTTVRAFTDGEVALLTTFADQAALAIENVRLFRTVEQQRAELARFAPQVASLLTTEDGERLLAGHRREITALFSDLRGFTAFAETAEPEEVLGVLREYHAAVGEVSLEQGGTIEHFAGDGLMVFFNDPAPLTDHPAAAVRAALDLRGRFTMMAERWRKRGYELGLGIGVALGYATLGRIGFEGRYDYGGVGNVVILASRLSDAAADGEILVSQRVAAALEDRLQADRREPMALKGLSRPVTAFAARALS